MNQKKTLPLILLACLLGLPACAPSLAPTLVNTQDPAQATAALQTRVAEIVSSTLAAQTQAAAATASAVAVQTEVAIGVASTLTALVNETPAFTFTPALSPAAASTLTPTWTHTPNFPRVTMGMDTNCRSGPGLAYEVLGVVKKGQSAEIVGQDAERGNWVIRLPSDPTVLCWVWRASATVTGDSMNAPIFTPQPTPTEVVDFQLTYAGFTSCTGMYEVKFTIMNTSQFTWESNQVNVTDRTTNVTTTINRDRFSNFDGCTLVGNDNNLAPGEGGTTTSNTFANNPTGHDMKATLQLCTAEGQSGICVAKSILFTP